MAQICPTAKAVGATELKDYRLLFRGERAAAVATVEPQKGRSVPVMLWELSPADEIALDRSVGCPATFSKEVLTVTLNRRRVKAFTHILHDGYPSETPSRYYYGLLLKGYREHGFNERTLAAALEQSATGEVSHDSND